MEFKKNQLCQVTIEDIGTDGEGIGKINGYTIFIKDAVIGDKVEAKIMKAKKNYAYAKLEKVLIPSSFRVEPKCMFHKQCGGCQIQAMSYDKQLQFKRNKVINNLIRIGGMEAEYVDRVMEKPVGMETPFYYRNKAQFPFGKNKEGKTITGFYAKRTHSIIENTDCALGVKENKRILEIILEYMEEKDIPPYDEENQTGLLRHVLIRKGFATGQLMVCLVINGKKLPMEEALVQKLVKVDGMTSISININTDKTNVIMGKELRLLYGREQIEDEIDGITFKISPLSFYQVNPIQTEKIYSKALEYAALSGQETVWDLYCGIGTISLFLARKAKQVYGVEIVPEAIQDARENAARNKIKNVSFYVGRAEEVLPEKYEKEGIFADVIVVDPPRKGCDPQCLQTMVRMQPERIVYVSCDSATLARDVKYLQQEGYLLKKACVFDNFPQSVHVETVVLLSHTKSDSHINVKVEFGEGEDKVPLDKIAERSESYKPKEQVTYKLIKEYIEAKYDFKVHTAYIAEVKRSLGLPMYDAPNAVEELKQPRKHTTPEKVEAIKDALKHFGIVK